MLASLPRQRQSPVTLSEVWRLKGGLAAQRAKKLLWGRARDPRPSIPPAVQPSKGDSQKTLSLSVFGTPEEAPLCVFYVLRCLQQGPPAFAPQCYHWRPLAPPIAEISRSLLSPLPSPVRRPVHDRSDPHLSIYLLAESVELCKDAAEWSSVVTP